MKKYAFLTAIILILGTLSGCMNEAQDGNFSVDLSGVEIEDKHIGNSDKNSESYSENFSENSSDTGYYRGIAECTVFEPEQVKTAIFGDEEITPQIIENNRRGYSIYIWEKDGLELNVNNDSSSVSVTSYEFFLADKMLGVPNQHFDGNIAEFERLNEDLDFCSRENAVENVREILAKFGVNAHEKADVYALHQDEMQRVVDEWCTDGGFEDFHDYMKGEEPKIITSYTVEKSEECYYIVLYQGYGGIPFYNEQFGYRTIKDLTIFQPSITAIYSADGLVGLSVSEYRGNVSQTETVSNLISAEDAAKAAAAKFAGISGIEDLTFDSLKLMYFIAPNYIDGKVNIHKANMIPAWVCTVRKTWYAPDKRTGREGLVTDKERILIDAVTGAEII